MKSTRTALNLTVYVALAASLPATLCRAADSVTTTTWLKLSPATSPSARSGPGMAYDPAQKLIVLFGGAAIGHNPDYLNDTWTFNGTTWAQLALAASPPPRQQPGMAYDYAAKQIVLFGGIGRGSTALRDTWTWNGTTWAKRQPANSPTSFPATQLFIGPKNGHADLFTLTSAGLPQTWQWNGSDWVLLSPANSPPARAEAAATLDNATGQAILYGGVTISNQPLTDTWAWDGANWPQLSPSTNPGPVEDAGALYDTQLKGIVMFAGEETGLTWGWIGSNWVQLAAAKSPPVFFDWGIAPNPANGLPVIFGGAGGANSPTDGTWEFVAKQ